MGVLLRSPRSSGTRIRVIATNIYGEKTTRYYLFSFHLETIIIHVDSWYDSHVGCTRTIHMKLDGLDRN